MSDEELAEQMRAFGEEAGPIIDTTRGVYQRKLAKLMAERAKGEEEGEEEEEEEEEEGKKRGRNT